MRLGYMGHLSLIADETVKFFERYPDEIFAVVESSLPQPGWNQFVATTLREARNRDSTPLSGSVPLQLPTIEQTHSSGFDDDDEFPLNTSRAMRATEAGDDLAKPSNATAETGESSLTDQVSVYLAHRVCRDPQLTEKSVLLGSSRSTSRMPSRAIAPTNSEVQTKTTKTTRIGSAAASLTLVMLTSRSRPRADLSNRLDSMIDSTKPARQLSARLEDPTAKT